MLLTTLATLLVTAGASLDFCYRKVGLYGTSDGDPPKAPVPAADFNIRNRILAQAAQLRASINWTQIRENAREEFNTACQSTGMYAYEITEIIVVAVTTCPTETTGNFSVVMDVNTTGNTIYMEVKECGLRITLAANGSCPFAMPAVNVTVVNSSIIITAVTGLVSTAPPFVSSATALTCLPLFIQNIADVNCSHDNMHTAVYPTPYTTAETFGNSTSRIWYRFNGDMAWVDETGPCKHVSYVNVSLTNTSRCADASMSTVATVATKTRATFYDTLASFGVTSPGSTFFGGEQNNETANLYLCMVGLPATANESNPCPTHVFDDAARKLVFAKFTGSHTLSRKRVVRALHENNGHCHHHSFGTSSGEECDALPRYVRDAPAAKPPSHISIPAAALAALKVPSPIPQGILDLQVDARGRSGPVAGLDDIRRRLEEDMRSALLAHLPLIPTWLSVADLLNISLTNGLHQDVDLLLGSFLRRKEQSVKDVISTLIEMVHASDGDLTRLRDTLANNEDNTETVEEGVGEGGEGEEEEEEEVVSVAETVHSVLSAGYGNVHPTPVEGGTRTLERKDVDVMVHGDRILLTSRWVNPHTPYLSGLDPSTVALLSLGLGREHAPPASPQGGGSPPASPPAPPPAPPPVPPNHPVLSRGFSRHPADVARRGSRPPLTRGMSNVPNGGAPAGMPASPPHIPVSIPPQFPPVPPHGIPAPPPPKRKESLKKPRRDKTKLAHSVCKRSLDSLLCGMLGKEPKQPTALSLATRPLPPLPGERRRTPSTTSIDSKATYASVGDFASRGPYREGADGISLRTLSISSSGSRKSTASRESDRSKSSRNSGQYGSVFGSVRVTKGAGVAVYSVVKREPDPVAKEVARPTRAERLTTSVAMVAQMATAQSTLRDVALHQNEMPLGMAVGSAISSVLRAVGGMFTVASNSPHAAAAGLVLQGVGMLIDLGVSLFYLISGFEKKPPPPDPVTEKFSSYAKYMAQSNAGARVCMMPDSDLTITLAYRHTDFNAAAGEKAILEFADTIPSAVMYLRSSNIVYHTKLTVICPVGTLRLLEGDVHAYTTLTRQDKSGKHYAVTGIIELLSIFPNASFTCGNEVGLTFRPFTKELKDMPLIRTHVPGEPNITDAVPSNVCDIFPLKRFYVLATGCPHDSSQTAVTYVSCGTLLRLATWDPEKYRWFLLYPFQTYGNEYMQLFTFKQFDFKNITINLNRSPARDAVCGHSSSTVCYWGEPMHLEDTTSCESRIRKLYLELSTIGSGGYDSFVLTCPAGSTPFHIVARGTDSGLVVISQNTRRTATRFASWSQMTVLISCIHNTNHVYKSDALMLTFRTNSMFPLQYFDMTHSAVAKYLFRHVAYNNMPVRSRICKRASEYSVCNIKYAIEQPAPEYTLHQESLPTVTLDTYYSGPLDKHSAHMMSRYFSSPVTINMDVSVIDTAFKTPANLWELAKKKRRTFSYLALTITTCSRVGQWSNIATRRVIQYLVFDGTIGANNDGTKLKFTHAQYTENDKQPPHPDLDNIRNCSAHIDIDSRKLQVECPSFSFPFSAFHNETEATGICVLLITSLDHCAGTTDLYDDYYSAGYGHGDAQTVYPSCNPSNKEQPEQYAFKENFCYFSYKSGWVIPLYDPCSSVMVLGYAPAMLSTRIVSPPYFATPPSPPSNNEFARTDMYQRLQTLYKEYYALVDYSTNPIVQMANKFGHALTQNAREIFRISADSQVLQLAFQADEERIRALSAQIETTLQDIAVHSLSYEELDAIRRHAIDLRCCVLEGTTVHRYFPENYLCGTYGDYVVEGLLGTRYLFINNSFVDEALYNSSRKPWVTCFDVSFLSVSTPEDKTRVLDALIEASAEKVVGDLVKEYDVNISAIIGAAIEEALRRLVPPQAPPRDPTVVAVVTSLATTSVFAVCLALLCLWRRRRSRHYPMAVRTYNEAVTVINLINRFKEPRGDKLFADRWGREASDCESLLEDTSDWSASNKTYTSTVQRRYTGLSTASAATRN
uniref:Surface glycoprotein n=1 Tax=Rousettus bat poxvirus TaxID=3141933 RepID=A0AAU7E242_9POXV